MKKYIDRLHFITHDVPGLPHTEQVQQACNAGAKWIQYRCLKKGEADLLTEINTIASICDDWGTTLIVTDHVQLAGKADIQGFHIEDFNADFIALRGLLGPNLTLGGSATNIANAVRLANEGVDYIGFGPFNTSATKPNDYPLIAQETYSLCKQTILQSGVDVPLIAVGGIQLMDVAKLLATGIDGIAVSNAIYAAPHLESAYWEFYNMVGMAR